MASEDVKTSESAVSTIVNLAEEAKLAREGVVKARSEAVLSICKSLVAGGVAGGLSVPSSSSSIIWILFFTFNRNENGNVNEKLLFGCWEKDIEYVYSPKLDI